MAEYEVGYEYKRMDEIANVIYGKHFYTRTYIKDDLLQEARIAMWKYMEKVESDDENIYHKLPLEALQAMRQYINRRYHLRTKQGYAEYLLEDEQLSRLRDKDDTLQTLLLLHDIRLIVKKVIKKVWRKEQYVILAILLLMGYTYKEIGEVIGWHEHNIYAKIQILGRGITNGFN